MGKTTRTTPRRGDVRRIDDESVHAELNSKPFPRGIEREQATLSRGAPTMPTHSTAAQIEATPSKRVRIKAMPCGADNYVKAIDGKYSQSEERPYEQRC